MLPADGLIHRASAQSGGGGNPPSGEQSRKLAKRIIAELGVKEIAELVKINFEPASLYDHAGVNSGNFQSLGIQIHLQ
jgi:hypothetical protein